MFINIEQEYKNKKGEVLMNKMDKEKEIPGGISTLKALIKPRSIAVIGASRRV